MAETPQQNAGAPRRQTGKQRAVRIPLDYYRTRDAMGRWRFAMVGLAPLVALGWWFGNSLLPGGTDRTVNHGPVWAGHAMWENDCESCHRPFTPIKSDAAFAGRGSTVLASSDQKCTTCHQGPVHHPNQEATLVESCGGCHMDHRGRDNDLNRVPDQQCTVCHAALPDAITGGSPHYGNVASFAAAHPNFAIRKASDDGLGEVVGHLTEDEKPADPSSLKFNHALHLATGLDSGYTFAKLAESDRNRYGYGASSSPDDAVTLDCNACHVLDGGDQSTPPHPADPYGAGNHPPKSSGTYMLPITFENHCQACHALTVPRPGADVPIAVPHGIQPDEVRTFLERTFAADALGADPSLRDRPAAGEAAPEGGQAADEARAAIERLLAEQTARLPGEAAAGEGLTLGAAMDRALSTAERTLFSGDQTCTECHHYDATMGREPASWRVVATEVPEVWFPHSVFDHAAHRAVSCDQCHAGAEESKTSDDLLLAPIGTCRECHAPAEYEGSSLVRGGVRSDCAECHRYHNGDRPLQGIGAEARQVAEADRRTIEEFLRGSESAKSKAAGPAAPLAE